MKRYILMFGVLGLVGCMLPFIGGTKLTLLDLRHARFDAWLVVLAFVVPVVVAWRGSSAATVIAALAGFGYAGYKLGPRAVDLILYAGIGGKLIGVAVIGGVIATAGAILEVRATRRSA